jgi:glutathione S-transferase
MQLYLAPGACSLADHIALREAGLEFERVKVDIPTRRTENGRDFTEVNPKGYVPALVLDDAQVLTENTAILCWIAERAPQLAPPGELGQIRLVEMLAFIAAEIHKPFVRIMFPTGDADKKLATELVELRLRYLAGWLKGEYLFGDRVSAADAYLLVMLRWAAMLGIAVPEPLPAFVERMSARPAVQRALRDEGLS